MTFLSSPAQLLLVLPLLLLVTSCCNAWIPPSLLQTRRTIPRVSPLFVALPDGYQEYGNEKIYSAASLCGASPEQISIEWKAGRIVVTVSGDVYVSDPLPYLQEGADDEEEVFEEQVPEGAVDVTTLARAINSALDDDGIGLAIAEAHEIEVTTPGASDELSGIMWESYKGFDVIAQHKDPKKNKIKTIEARLVERNDEFTVLNIKGRMKKLENENVVSVKLPKAKKEKGVR